jgi:hypothetical protein
VQLKINSSATIKLTSKLEVMNRSALPVAVRTALNSAAFDVKQRTMPASAKRNFIQRKPSFFQANSKVQQAQGFDIKTMKATVGFQPKSGTDKSVDDLQQQEHGGEIGGRAFIALKQARTGLSWAKPVRSGARIADIRNTVIDSANAPGANDKEKFIKSAIHAGKGGNVIGNRVTGGNKIMFKIRSIIRKDGDTIVNATPMDAVKRGRKVRPRATNFMKEASLESAQKLEQFYITSATKQINKLMK